MSKKTIKEILGDYKKLLHHDITIQGWVRAFRSNRFIALNDGSTINNIQIVVDFENFDEEIIKNIRRFYPYISIKDFSNEEIINLMINDKKNNHGKINFSLLEGVGKCNFDYKVSAENIEKSLEFYRNLEQ